MRIAVQELCPTIGEDFRASRVSLRLTHQSLQRQASSARRESIKPSEEALWLLCLS
jgi:hypothetical protein